MTLHLNGGLGLVRQNKWIFSGKQLKRKEEYSIEMGRKRSENYGMLDCLKKHTAILQEYVFLLIPGMDYPRYGIKISRL